VGDDRHQRLADLNEHSLLDCLGRHPPGLGRRQSGELQIELARRDLGCLQLISRGAFGRLGLVEGSASDKSELEELSRACGVRRGPARLGRRGYLAAARRI